MTTVQTTQLLTARRLRQVSQKTLARKAKISQSYLVRLEKTGHVPSDEVQARIASVLKFDKSELFKL